MKKVRVLIKDGFYFIPDNKEEFEESYFVEFSVNNSYKLLQGYGVKA